MENVRTPKRTKYYYLRQVVLVVFIVAVSLFTETIWFDELLFGAIVVSILVHCYRLVIKEPQDANFALVTQYDKISRAFSVLCGLALMTWSVKEGNSMKSIELVWINYLIIGFFSVVSAFRTKDSIIFVLKEQGHIEVEDYDFTLSAQTKVVSLSSHQILVSTEDDENFIFDELNISEKVSKEFAEWMSEHMPESSIEIKWTD